MPVIPTFGRSMGEDWKLKVILELYRKFPRVACATLEAVLTTATYKLEAAGGKVNRKPFC